MPEHWSSPSAVAVSVIVPTFNEAGAIDACLRSLRAQRLPAGEIEILVVDNGSTDGTLDRLRAWGDLIRVMHEPVRGASAARNRGVRDARGPIVAFTDADCTVEPGWLAALIAPLEDPAVGITGGPILSRVGANRIERFGEAIHAQRRSIEDFPPYVASGNWASSRQVLLEVGLFDLALQRGQDVDLSWRVFRAGYRLVFVDGARVRHENQRTLRGLIREGYVHGLHGVALARKHTAHFPEVRRHFSTPLRRLRRDVAGLRSGEPTLHALLRIAFDVGKALGEWRGLARGGPV